MAWIESHQELARHPKTRRLARALGVSVPTALGHLHLLWWWALDYAQDGWLGEYTAEDIADAALWEGDPQTFWAAMCDARFFTDSGEGMELHDWQEYAGRLLEKRRQDADRKRKGRGPRLASGGRPPDIQRTARVTVPNRTVPNRTGDEDEGDDARTAAAVAPPEPANGAVVPKRKTRDLGPLVDAFRHLGLSPPQFTGAEAKAAAALLGHWTPADLATCWQDHASGEYGDDFSRRELSFGYLSVRNRVGNWDAWRQEATLPLEPAEPPPRREPLWCQTHELAYGNACWECERDARFTGSPAAEDRHLPRAARPGG